MAEIEHFVDPEHKEHKKFKARSLLHQLLLLMRCRMWRIWW